MPILQATIHGAEKNACVGCFLLSRAKVCFGRAVQAGIWQFALRAVQKRNCQYLIGMDVLLAYAPLNSGLRFSINAFMPSFWSSEAKHR